MSKTPLDKNSETVLISIKLPKVLLEKLKAEAERRGVNVSELIRLYARRF